MDRSEKYIVAASRQINCLYHNSAAIATGSVAAGGDGFTPAYYWSSTQQDSTHAYALDFSNGSSAPGTKDTVSLRVRCTRAFYPFSAQTTDRYILLNW